MFNPIKNPMDIRPDWFPHAFYSVSPLELLQIQLENGDFNQLAFERQQEIIREFNERNFK
jgi:hypothetical protein